jgi:hypothetical protein
MGSIADPIGASREVVSGSEMVVRGMVGIVVRDERAGLCMYFGNKVGGFHTT